MNDTSFLLIFVGGTVFSKQREHNRIQKNEKWEQTHKHKLDHNQTVLRYDTRLCHFSNNTNTNTTNKTQKNAKEKTDTQT